VSLSPALAAVLVLTAGAVVVLLLAARISAKANAVVGLGLVTLLLALVPALSSRSPELPAVLAVAALAALALLLLPNLEVQERAQLPEIGALLLLGSAGAIVLATADNLISLALGLETLSLSVAIATALGRGDRPLEAGFKYFVLAAVSFAALIYGIGLYALATGSLSIGAPPPREAGMLPVYVAGLVLIALGFGFELAVAPLHFGGLSAYLGAAPGLAGYVMTVSKLGAALALARLAVAHDVPVNAVLVSVGVLSIGWGTFAALAQRTLRGLLGYSAIVHAGFVALALGCGPAGRSAAIFYVLTYAPMAALAFAALAGLGTGPLPVRSLVQPEEEPAVGDSLADARLGPLRSLALALALLSLAGIPPTPGFWAKLAVLGPAWQVAGPLPAIVAVAGGVAGALYYLRPLPDLFATLRQAVRLTGAPAPSLAALTPLASLAVLLATLAVLLFSLVPGLAFALATLSQARG
jgi:NADH-quinone oxidoreductase subunit N